MWNWNTFTWEMISHVKFSYVKLKHFTNEKVSHVKWIQCEMVWAHLNKLHVYAAIQ